MGGGQAQNARCTFRGGSLTYLRKCVFCTLCGRLQGGIFLQRRARRVLLQETKKSACSCCALQGAPCCFTDTAESAKGASFEVGGKSRGPLANR